MIQFPDINNSSRGEKYVTPTFVLNQAKEEIQMPRNVGDRYVCEKCGAQLVYEKACPCPQGMPHSEICCGEQMKLVQKQSAAKTDKK